VGIAAGGRVAWQLPTAEVAGELARRAAAHALDSKQQHDAPLDFQDPRSLHSGNAANDARARRRWDVACGRGRERRDARLRPNRLGPSRGALGYEFVPDARGQIAAGHASGRGVVVIAHPYADDDIVGESDDPCVLIALARPRLPLGRDADPRPPSRALANDACENVMHGRPRGWIARRLQLRLLPRKQHLITIANVANAVG